MASTRIVVHYDKATKKVYGRGIADTDEQLDRMLPTDPNMAHVFIARSLLTSADIEMSIDGYKTVAERLNEEIAKLGLIP